jgi:hypothetical protein
MQKNLKDMLFKKMLTFKEIRLIVRELDTTGREVSLILQQIHQEDGLNQSKNLFFGSSLFYPGLLQFINFEI